LAVFKHVLRFDQCFEVRFFSIDNSPRIAAAAIYLSLMAMAIFGFKTQSANIYQFRQYHKDRNRDHREKHFPHYFERIEDCQDRRYGASVNAD
jgi:hypothetical protein